MLDAQLSCHMGLEAQIRLCDIKAPLPTTEPDVSEPLVLFGSVLSSLLEYGKLPMVLDDIGMSCLAYALYRYAQRATDHGI